jgi:carbamoyltransferase
VRVPSVTRGTGRLQTVSKEANPLYWRLIDEFRKITDVSVVLNTSFNLKGEPIVCSPQDAVNTFYSSGLDALILGDFLVEK